MRRNEFAQPPLSPTAMQAAYQEELFRRKYLQAQQQRQQQMMGRRRLADVIFNERRHSFDMQPDYPVNPKFMHPSMFVRSPGSIITNDSLSSLLDADYDGDTSADVLSILSQTDDSDVYFAGAGAGVYHRSASITDPEVISTVKVVRNLTAVGRFLEMLQRWPLPRLSFTTACFCFLLAIFLSPRTCAERLLFPAFRLAFATLYPAYASYKAVRTKNVKEYVKWMMYWIVFALFSFIETFTDIFVCWFPFYYEIKVLFVLWLLSPTTRGSSLLYRKFVHPILSRKEEEIDEYINHAKERGYSAVLQLGSKGVNYATNVIMQTALKAIEIGQALTTAKPAAILPASQSEPIVAIALNLPQSRNQDENDGFIDQWLPRAESLNVLHEAQFDEPPNAPTGLVIEEIATVDYGAARIREPPPRKTTSRSRITDADGTNVRTRLRGRRKLRQPTPEMEVDVEE